VKEGQQPSVENRNCELPENKSEREKKNRVNFNAIRWPGSVGNEDPELTREEHKTPQDQRALSKMTSKKKAKKKINKKGSPFWKRQRILSLGSKKTGVPAVY